MYAVLELRPKNFISKNVKIIEHTKNAKQKTREQCSRSTLLSWPKRQEARWGFTSWETVMRRHTASLPESNCMLRKRQRQWHRYRQGQEVSPPGMFTQQQKLRVGVSDINEMLKKRPRQYDTKSVFLGSIACWQKCRDTDRQWPFLGAIACWDNRQT